MTGASTPNDVRGRGGAAQPGTDRGAAGQPGTGRLFDEVVAAKVIMLATLLRRSQALRYQKMVGLALVESRMVTRIGTSGPMSLNTLAEQIGIGKSQSSRVVSNLVERGLVNRTRNPANPREVELTLSPEGQSIFDLLLEAGAIRNKELTGNIPEKDLAVVHRVLATMIESARGLLEADQKLLGDGTEEDLQL